MSGTEAFDSIARTLLKDVRITHSQMFGSPGLKVGGKVFAMLYKGKLVIKLPQTRVKALVATGDGELFDPGHGRLMKEWVAGGQGAKAEWLPLVREARDFVASGQVERTGRKRR